VIWLGGLMFQSAVLLPAAATEGECARAVARKSARRFVGFVWMSVWTMLITGVLMMLLDPRFVWFRFDTSWSVLLGIKQLVFVVMVVYAFGYARMLAYLDRPASNGGFDENAELYRHRLDQFRRISIALGITAVLIAVSM
jgi:uncharacterized membrane protein